MVAHEHEERHEQGHAEGRPDQLDRRVLPGDGALDLLRGEVEAVDDGQPEAHQEGDRREQQRIGVGRPLADDEVGDHPQRGDPHAEAGHLRAERAGDREVDDALGDDGDQDGEAEQCRLGAAPRGDRRRRDRAPGIGGGTGHQSALRQFSSDSDDEVVRPDVVVALVPTWVGAAAVVGVPAGSDGVVVAAPAPEDGAEGVDLQSGSR